MQKQNRRELLGFIKRWREERGEGTSLQKLAEYHSAAGFVLKATAALDAADEVDASSPFASSSSGCSHVGEGKFIAPQALHLCKNEITLRLQFNKRNEKNMRRRIMARRESDRAMNKCWKRGRGKATGEVWTLREQKLLILSLIRAVVC
jgi:hypothetical protein